MTRPLSRFLLLACALGVATAISSVRAEEKPPAGKLTKSAKNPVEKPSATELLQMDDGRSGRGNLIATTGVRGFTKPATATAHALIMTIGDYQGGVPKLSGVTHDAATATEIARRLGVPPANIKVLREGELNLEGMRKAFDELEAKLSGNDQVFIYYSGHGGRQMVPEENGQERCAEMLITHDAQGLLDSELEARMKRIAANSQKTVMFLDACHSGGVTTRAVGSKSGAYTAKTYTAPGQSCVKPTNVLTRNIKLVRAPGSGGSNFVHIAAARDSEISLDQPGKGGVASQAWLACLSGAAKDSDGSGGLSAEEVRTCAQERIDQQLKNVAGYLPHHVSVNGNQAMVLSYAAREEDAPAAVSPAPTSATGATKPQTVAPIPPTRTPVVAPAAKPSALAALNDIYNSRDDRRLVTVAAPRTKLKIGKDPLDFSITSREGGYVYVLMVGSDGQTFDLLFPNKIDTKNVIDAGGTLRLPGASWQITVEGPPGKDTLLVMVTDSPRDFTGAGLKPSGPFSTIDVMAAKDIQLVTAGTSRAVTNECAESQTTRTLAVKKRCSTSYAAALLTIEEAN